jgi:hypothetical protein
MLFKPSRVIEGENRKVNIPRSLIEARRSGVATPFNNGDWMRQSLSRAYKIILKHKRGIDKKHI